MKRKGGEAYFLKLAEEVFLHNPSRNSAVVLSPPRE
jgi:hypothetical protein